MRRGTQSRFLKRSDTRTRHPVILSGVETSLILSFLKLRDLIRSLPFAQPPAFPSISRLTSRSILHFGRNDTGPRSVLIPEISAIRGFLLHQRGVKNPREGSAEEISFPWDLRHRHGVGGGSAPGARI